mmetsp:Transcript_851/g.3342  ORF Transcript_851/g.3342 Transcript_851/m.3342 type:complete len:87 (+) Transcript_851:354-614(+)
MGTVRKLTPHWLHRPKGRAMQEYALRDVLSSAIAIELEGFEPLAKLVWTFRFAHPLCWVHSWGCKGRGLCCRNRTGTWICDDCLLS